MAPTLLVSHVKSKLTRPIAAAAAILSSPRTASSPAPSSPITPRQLEAIQGGSNEQDTRNAPADSAAAAACGGPIQKLYNAANPKIIRNEIQFASSAVIQQAIEDATMAQEIWYRDYTPSQRSEILQKAFRIVTKHSKEFLHHEVTDTGRPISEIQSYDVPTASRSLSYYANLPSILCHATGSYQELDHSFAIVRREPVGVTVGIGAWNYPLMNAVLKSAPALTFGNAMLFKPSELTPNSALLLADIYEKAGVPPGVFQVLLGDGCVGKELIQSQHVGKISFTGSAAKGRELNRTVALASAEHGYFPKITLELGGKSPLIVMEDADLEQAVMGAMIGNWYSNGQVCSNGTRVFVHESLVGDFLDKIVERTKRLKIGDPMRWDTDVGPMVSENHMKRVLEYIDIGKNVDGATLVYGGERLSCCGDSAGAGIVHDRERNPLENGFYLSPAIFAECTDDIRIVREEVFGMVMSVLSFQDEEEVIARANASDYGLAAGIFTKDIKRAFRMANRLVAGNVWVNNYNLGPVELPWGGRKQSGVGRENGSLDAVFEWTHSKSIHVETGNIS